jgi:hypothetical protein
MSARIPWRTAFRAERAFPSGVFGPLESLALARLAASFFSETWIMMNFAGPWWTGV